MTTSSRGSRGLWLALALAIAALLTFQFLRGAEPEHAVLDPRAPAEAKLTDAPVELEPLAEPATTAPADQRVSAEGARVLVRVVDPAGLAVAGAQVALFRHESLLALATSDAAGNTSFEPANEPAEYALYAPGWALTRGDIELSPGEHTLTLVEGAVVAGSVLIDGALPAEPLALKYQLTDRTTGEAVLPKPVQLALRAARGGGFGAQTFTLPDGTFEFRGLPAACAGTLLWVGPYCLEGTALRSPGTRLTVASARRDLLVRLEMGFELRLRVVDQAGVPVPGAPVTVNRSSGAEARGTSRMNTTADSEGRFVRDFFLAPDSAMEVVVALSGGAAAKKYDVRLPVDGRGILDLGDLATDAARQVGVLVLDDADAPLAGALVAPLPWSSQSKTLTDAAGRIQVPMGVQDHRLGVTALGFLGNRIEVPPGVAEVVARMTRATSLECFVAGASDAKHGLRLLLSGPYPLFVGQDDEGPDTPQFSESSSMTVDATTTSYEPRAGKDGRWKIAGLVTGEALRVELTGSDGVSLCAVDIAPLAASEERVVELHPAAASRSLRIRVLGPDRAVLPKASVRIATDRSIGEALSFFVDAQGEVELASVYGDPCGIEGRAPGFPPRIVVVRGAPAEPVEILLETPRSIEVELVSHDGRPLGDPLMVHASSSAGGERGSPLGAGRFRIDNLPTGVVLLRAFGPTGMTTCLHDTREPFVRITLGSPGQVSARFTRPPDRPDSKFAFALASSGGAVDRTRAELDFDPLGKGVSTLRGFSFGAYDVWLEQRAEDDWDSWTRVGSAQPVVLDAEHPEAQVELHL